MGAQAATLTSKIPFSSEHYFQFFWQYIDGNWIDICTILVALAYGFYKASCSTANPKPKLISKATGLEIANATSIFPLIILFLSFTSSWLLGELLSANKAILSIAGLTALLSVLEN